MFHRLIVLFISNIALQFDSKVDHYESDSDDADESLTVPKPPVNDVRGFLS